jgi:uncharacterized protein YndB with AHSA1/START domain
VIEENSTPGELTYTRVFDAPRDLVFRCMTDPAHLTHFWGPVGVATPLDGIIVEARPGGVFQTVMVNDTDGSRFVMYSIYDEVVEPEKLVWSDPATGMTTTSTFVALDDRRTEVHICQTNVPAPFRSPEAQAGFKTSLDRFAIYLLAFDGDVAGRGRTHSAAIGYWVSGVFPAAISAAKARSRSIGSVGTSSRRSARAVLMSR